MRRSVVLLFSLTLSSPGCGESGKNGSSTGETACLGDPHGPARCGPFDTDSDGETTDTSPCEPGTLGCECDADQCQNGAICEDGICAVANACNDPAVATTPCGTECAFPPDTIDCMAACENVAQGCTEEACPVWVDDYCASESLDLATCEAECETAKFLTCDNIGYGCWASAGPSCEAVPDCVDGYL